jgi:catechol 2,3-dioxygenase-like lactoylglutathione lyase family enzyme
MPDIIPCPIPCPASPQSIAATRLSRRAFSARILAAGAAILPLTAGSAAAQDAAPQLLPLRTPKIDHLDVIVPNVEAAARFYMGVFRTTLHAQPFQGGQRYFILFGDLPANRQVGYVAIGDARGRGPSIGHFCTSVFDYRRDATALAAALTEASEKGGFGKLTIGGGFGGIFQDPDGIEIQFLPAPDTLVTAAVPSQLVPWQQGLVTPTGVDHVLLHVADLDKGVRFYRILYGKEAQRTANPDRVWFQIGDTRLGLEQAPAGQKPKIAHFGVKVMPFDRGAVTAGLAKLGAPALPSPDEPSAVRLRDPDGNVFELVAGQ